MTGDWTLELFAPLIANSGLLGRVHIGVQTELGNPDLILSDTIVPVGHVHQQQAYLHDPTTGASGALRYTENQVEVSQDGGQNFGPLVAGSGINAINGDTGPNVDLIGVSGTAIVTNGDGTIDINTGALSGAVSELGFRVDVLELASGIAQISNGGNSQTVPLSATTIVYDTVDIPDDGYTLDAGTGELTINLEGLYEVSYTNNYEKSVGGGRTVVRTGARLNGSTSMPHSFSYAYCRSTAVAEGTGHAQFLLNLDAGDVLDIRAINLDNTTVITIQDECWLTIRRLGPKRTGSQ